MERHGRAAQTSRRLARGHLVLLSADMVALSETSSVQRNLKLLYGFSFFDPFMIVIPVWVPNLILDNSSTHKTPAIHRWLARHPRFHLHFTPTGASWINLVERWFAALT